MNIGVFSVKPSQGWVKVEDLIKEIKADFEFKVDGNYLFQVTNYISPYKVCVKDVVPSEKEGFLMNDSSKLEYTHKEGATFYIKALEYELDVNIAE